NADLLDVSDTSTCTTSLNNRATNDKNDKLNNVHKYTSSEWESKGTEYSDL
ncbi:2806_t:CDS:1, partial [Gigaspora margarita]